MFNKLNKKKPYIIAEIGSNHNGSLILAKKQIKLAKKSGCDAVKFQSWDLTLNSKITYKKNKQIYQQYKKFKLDYLKLLELRNFSKKNKIDFGLSIFSKKELLNAEKMHVDFLKIASMDLNNYNFIKECSKSKKTLIVSTGFSNEKEIIKSSKIIKRNKKKNVVFLHCISLYPPKKIEMINLLNMKKISKLTGFKTGFSDHTTDPDIMLTAATLGASVIEKHFTSNKKLKGWDHSISADYKEMSLINKKINKIVLAKGGLDRKLSGAEIKQGRQMRRSIHLKKNLEKNSKN